jgi:hypothetical protein
LRCCPFCGSPVDYKELGDCAIQIVCLQERLSGPFWWSSLSVIFDASNYDQALALWNNRPLEIRQRMRALAEAEAVASNYRGKRVDTGYAISRQIKALKDLPTPTFTGETR